MVQPVADRRQMAEVFFPLAMAIMAPQSEVAADHDILHAPTRPPHIPRWPRRPPGSGPIGRHDVAGIADDEHLARLLLGHQFGYDAAVRAGNEQRPGRLSMRQLVEQLGPLVVSRLAELQKILQRGSFMAWSSSIFR